ncbi:hypothetical protein CRG98_027289 [Punica granatum]|uniref:Uncharacterized protein n=1 Tax=Punica granatum TaxID=22663 RepID=A0A2I0J8L4_PUNGR|nr:hypothetical protein CRG98_027289 [Punica granatum]
MASSETLQRTEKSSDDQSLKLALAISLLRSKLQHKQPPPPPPSLPPPPPPPEADALRWKRKVSNMLVDRMNLMIQRTFCIFYVDFFVLPSMIFIPCMFLFMYCKAKERKQEILRLREDLKVAEDASRAHQVPEVASCKCYFYNELGKMSSKELVDGSDCSFSDVLRRRFLKQDLNKEDETEQLISAVDFLVDLCDTVFSVRQLHCCFM